MASGSPTDLVTRPNSRIVFNAPYDNRRTYQIKVMNMGNHRIGYAIKTTNVRRLDIDPPAGVLDPNETVVLAVSCDSFDVDSENIDKDRLTIEWINAPEDASDKHFRREWFLGDGVVRRKCLSVEYNP